MRRRSKYGNRKIIIDGITFDSVSEGRRYNELKLLQRAGVISDLELQPLYRIEVNGMHVCRWKLDFRYVKDGETVVEDVKSKHTAKNREYRLKKKLIKAVLGVDVEEVIYE